MSRAHGSRPVFAAVLAVGGLAVAAAAAGRAGVDAASPMPAAAASAAPVAVSRALVFADLADGRVAVRDARTGDTAAMLPRGDGGFVRGTLRALARERRRRGVADTAPFHLTRYADGRLTLADSGTRSHVELAGFGPTNAAAFARMLDR